MYINASVIPEIAVQIKKGKTRTLLKRTSRRIELMIMMMFI
jgi:hypothetical protein